MAKPKFRDPNGAHVRVYHTTLKSPAFRVLSFSAKALFFMLQTELTATNNGNISAPLSEMKHLGWTSQTTLAKCLYELRSLGFIAVTRGGGLKMQSRICTLYRFTFLDVFDQPKVSVQAIKATHDYLKFKTVREAEIALETGMAALKVEGTKKQTSPKGRKNLPVQKLDYIGPEIGPKHQFIRPVSGQGSDLSVQKMAFGGFS